MEPMFILSGENKDEDVAFYSLVVDTTRVMVTFVGPKGEGVIRMDWKPGDDMVGLFQSLMEFIKEPLLNGRFYQSEITTGDGWMTPYPVRDQADAVWDVVGEDDMVKVMLVDGAEEVKPNLDDLVWGQVTGGEITSVLFIDDGDVPPMMEGTAEVVTAGRGMVEFDAEGRIVRVEWDEEE